MVTKVHGESVVDAAAGNDTNVNHIMERFQRTGFLPPASREAQYADVSNLGDLTDTMVRTQDALRQAQDAASDAEQNDAMPETTTTNDDETGNANEGEAVQAPQDGHPSP